MNIASLYGKLKGWMNAAFRLATRKPLLSSLIIIVAAGLLTTGIIVAMKDDPKPADTAKKDTSSQAEDTPAAGSPQNTDTPKSSQSKPKSGSGNTSKPVDPCVADPDICNFAKATYDYSKVAHTIEESKKPNGRTDLKWMFRSADGQGNSRSILYTPGHETETVLYDGYIYQKDNADGTWMKYNATDPAAPAAYKPSTKSAVTINHSEYNYKKSGTTACGSAQCFVYGITSKGSDAAYWNGTLIFETENYRLHSYRSDTSAPTYSYFTSFNVIYTDVTISEPSPVKNP